MKTTTLLPPTHALVFPTESRSILTTWCSKAHQIIDTNKSRALQVHGQHNGPNARSDDLPNTHHQTPPSLTDQSFGNVLEYDLVHTFVYLILLLVPYTVPQTRKQIMYHLLDLASILGSVHKKEYILTALNPELALLLSNFGPNLAQLAIHAVPLLTSFLTHHQPSIRAVATRVITHLLSTHHTLFDQHDQVSVIWDFLFALTSTYTKPIHSGTYRRHKANSHSESVDRSDRREIIDALNTLAFVFEKNADLNAEIVHGLFRLNVKTDAERTAIQATLKRLSCIPNINMPVLVIEQIRTDDDDALDMVAWAVAHLVKDSPIINLLESHIISPQPAIRYGCALVIATYCQVHPDQVVAIAPILTVGWFDQCLSVSLVYKSLFNELKTSPTDLVNQYKADIPVDLIERVASGIEYLSNHAEQLTALAFLDVWADHFKSTESVPLLLVQSLVSCLRSTEVKICTAALKVLAKLTRVMGSLTSTPIHPHIHLIWTYLCKLPSEMWTLEAKLFPTLAPMLQTQADFYTHLVMKMLSSSPLTRIAIYTVLKQICNTKSESTYPVGILVLALGDMDYKALEAATDALIVYKPGLKSLLSHLCQTRLHTHDLSALVPIYEDIATATVDHGLLSALVAHEPSMDYIWYTYLPKSIDQSVTPSPDEFEFANALQVHSPMWLGFILCRVNVLPPPTISTSKRTEIPVLLSLRRRFYCGYMLLIFPMLGFPDIVVRQAACLNVVMSVLPKGQVSNFACKSLIDYTTSVLITHKAWPYVCSAMDIAGLLIRMKIPAVSQYMSATFVVHAIDLALNSLTTPIRVCAFNLLSVMCTVFPLSHSPRLAEIRDTARQCMVDSDTQVSIAAANVYVQVYSLLPEQEAPQFVEYIFSELAIIRARSPVHLQADPLLQNLAPLELRQLVILHLCALRQVRSPLLSPKIVQMCLPMLSSPSKLYRQYALMAVLQHFSNLSSSEKSVAGWACLPLFADAAPSVSSIIAAYMSNGYCLDKFADGIASCSPQPDDSIAPTVLTLDEIFDGQDSYSIPKKQNQILNDPQSKNGSSTHTSRPRTYEQTPENIGFLISALAGKVSAVAEPQVMYNFERAADNKHLLAGTLIAISEFCCMHESTLSHVIGVLVKNVQAQNKTAMASMIRISEHSAQTFQYILDTLLTVLANSSELELGIIECLRLLVPSICIGNSDKVDYMLASLIPSVTMGRFHYQARVLAADLVTDLLIQLKPNTEHSTNRMAHVMNFFDSLHNVIIKDESSDPVYEMLRRLTAEYGPTSHPHQLFAHLKDQAIKFAFEGSENQRLEAIDMISCTCLDEADALMCNILFLADDRPSVVDKAVHLLNLNPIVLEEYVRQCGFQYLLKIINQIMAIWLQSEHNTTNRSSESVTHLFEVTKKLFRVADTESAEQLQIILIDHLKVASANSHRLRAAQFNVISRYPLSFEEYAGIRIVESAEGLVAPRQFNNRTNVGDPQPIHDHGTEETDLAKVQISGEFDAQRTYLLGNLADRQTELDYWVNSQTHLLTILGYARALKPDILLHHLQDDHRGVRSAAVQALLTLKMSRHDTSAVITNSLSALKNDTHKTSQRLHYRKLDHLRLIVGLGRELNTDVLDALILAWRDPIQSVRVSAISLVRHVGVFDEVTTNRLMEAIGTYVSRDDYPEQFSLQELMAWFIGQMH